MTPEKNIVVIGAGALGLGFLGPELSRDAQVWFLDQDEKADLLGGIERDRAYTVNLVGARIRPLRVENVRGMPASDGRAEEIIARADLCFTAIGGSNLPAVAPLLRSAARRRGPSNPLPVLCAENEPKAAEGLSGQIGGEENVAVSDTVMGRMCRWLPETGGAGAGLFGAGGPAVVAEEYYGIPYRRSGLAAAPPFDALLPREDARFALEEHVKLFAHNCVHGMFAHAAARRGSTRISEIGKDRQLHERARRMLRAELRPALERAHGDIFVLADYLNYTAHLVRRIVSPEFADTVERGTRGSAEKLGPEGRWVAAVRFVRGAGVPPDAYLEALADVIAVSGLAAGRDPRAVLSEHCGFSAEEVEEMLPRVEDALGAH